MPSISFAPPPQAGVNIQICATSGTTGDCAQGASNTNVAAPPGTGGFPTPVEPEPPVEPSADGGVEEDSFIEAAPGYFVSVEFDPTYVGASMTAAQVQDRWRFSGQEGPASRAAAISAMAAAHADLVNDGTPIPAAVASEFWNLEVRWVGTDDGTGEELRTPLAGAVYVSWNLWLTNFYSRLLDGEFQSQEEFRQEMRQAYDPELREPFMAHTVDNESGGASLASLFPEFLSAAQTGLSIGPETLVFPTAPAPIQASCACKGNSTMGAKALDFDADVYPGVMIWTASGKNVSGGFLDGDLSDNPCVGGFDLRSCSVEPSDDEQCSRTSRFSKRKVNSNEGRIRFETYKITCTCPGEDHMYTTLATRESCASPLGAIDSVVKGSWRHGCKDLLLGLPCTTAKALGSLIVSALF